MIGFDNRTLDKQPALKAGDSIDCLQCGQKHVVQGGKNAETGQATDLLLFYKCGEASYLAAVSGRSVVGLKPDVSRPDPDQDTKGLVPLSVMEVRELLKAYPLDPPLQMVHRVMATLAAWLPQHQRCTCDDIGEGTCPLHANEHRLLGELRAAQLKVKAYQQLALAAAAELKGLQEEVQARTYWKAAYEHLKQGSCLSCGDLDPHRLRKFGE